jgi:hypothetical protein
MAEKSDFTPAQSELHQFWLDSWHKKRHEGPYSPDDIAETLFSVGLTVWWAHQCGNAEAARRLYMLAENFAAMAQAAGEYPEHKSHASPAKH